MDTRNGLFFLGYSIGEVIYNVTLSDGIEFLINSKNESSVFVWTQFHWSKLDNCQSSEQQFVFDWRVVDGFIY